MRPAGGAAALRRPITYGSRCGLLHAKEAVWPIRPASIKYCGAAATATAATNAARPVSLAGWRCTPPEYAATPLNQVWGVDHRALTTAAGDPPLPADLPADSQLRLLEYPTVFELKVVGLKDDTFADDMHAACARAGGFAASELTLRWRDSARSGKYRAVTLRGTFAGAEQIHRCYAAVGADTRVRFVV
jgi:putative lipoic acid-binding regulatory protein